MQFQVAQQGIYDSLKTTVYGYELLSRWINKTGMILVPEQMHSIDWCEVDLNVIRWLENAIQNKRLEPFVYFINVSSELLLCDKAFKEWLDTLVRIEHDHCVKCVVEITENVPSDLLDLRYGAISSTASYMALDDYSYRYSNLNRLKGYKWDFCKFNTRDLEKDEVQLAINICLANDVKMISECIEGVYHLRKSLQHGLKLQQGFLWHRPEIKLYSQKNNLIGAI